MEDITFKRWIKKYDDGDSRYGELAREIEGDPAFPDTTKRQEMISYMKEKSYSDRVVDLFKSVYDEYRVFRKRMIMTRH